MNNTEQPRLNNDDLYFRQVAMLKTFLTRHAISKEQYDKSCHDLTVKMYPDGINISEDKRHADE